MTTTPNDVSNHDNGDAGAIGNQYSTSGDDDQYPFSDCGGSEVVSWAVQVVPLVQEDTIGAHAAKASKPDAPKPKAVESNRAHYKIGAGRQPSHELWFQ